MAGPHQGEWVERLDREHANLRAAAGWSLDRVLSAAPALPAADRAALLYPAAVLAATQDDDDAATGYGVECQVLAEAVGDRQTITLAGADLLRRSRSPVGPADLERRDAAVAAARTALGGIAFAAAWRAGRSLPTELIVQEAHSV